MAFLPLRSVSLPERAEAAYDAWLDDLDARLDAPGADWSRVVRQALLGLFHPDIPDWDAAVDDPGRSPAARAALLALDPRNITLEPEYYADVDSGALRPGQAAALALVLASTAPRSAGSTWTSASRSAGCSRRTSSRACGANFKCFQHVEFSFGYKLEVGDDVVVHRHVLLDDRGGITLGDRVSISDYANIYSRTRTASSSRRTSPTPRTVLEDDVRITYHATVLAGVRVGENGMVGANARRHQGRAPLPRARRDSRPSRSGSSRTPRPRRRPPTWSRGTAASRGPPERRHSRHPPGRRSGAALVLARPALARGGGRRPGDPAGRGPGGA